MAAGVPGAAPGSAETAGGGVGVVVGTIRLMAATVGAGVATEGRGAPDAGPISMTTLRPSAVPANATRRATFTIRDPLLAPFACCGSFIFSRRLSAPFLTRNTTNSDNAANAPRDTKMGRGRPFTSGIPVLTE